jgi:transcriptional regulator with XRE-family HTH domain
VLGGRLRALRAGRQETLAETAERAGISPQYLSEVERGRKEPSSEMIAALAGALDTTLADLTTQVTEDLRHSRSARSDRGPRASSAPSATVAPVAPSAPSAPIAPSAPVLLALAA